MWTPKTRRRVAATDLRGATVVTLYLLPRLLVRLLPKLRAELAPGPGSRAHWRELMAGTQLTALASRR